MDYGFAPGTTAHHVRVRSLLQRRVPATTLRGSRPTLKDFIEDIDTDSSITKPVGDLIVGAHASSEGFIFLQMFPTQRDFSGDPTNDSDFEVLESATTGTARPIRVPDSLIGFTTPPPTHNLHFKGCNIGRDRFDSAKTPAAPYLVKLKEALGGHINVTAPKHFHGVATLDSGAGTFEYMAQEFVVRTKAVKQGRRFTGFANRAAAITAFSGAGFSYHDTTPVPAGDWTALIPTNISQTFRVTVSLPLGQTVADQTTLGVGREFRVELARVDWTFTPTGGIPGNDAGKLAALRSNIAADSRFQSTHPWPAYERVGFPSFAAYFDGHLWSTSVSGNDLVCIGRRYDYTVLLAIVDRTVTPPANRPLIFNFFPSPSSAQAAITTGFTESNNTFFGRA